MTTQHTLEEFIKTDRLKTEKQEENSKPQPTHVKREKEFQDHHGTFICHLCKYTTNSFLEFRKHIIHEHVERLYS